MILIRHILREHIAPFFYSLIIITGLFLVDFVVQILDSILTKGLPWRVVLELFFLNAAWMLALSVPMSVLVASLMAFGRMSADGEIDAMRSSGLHPAKMLLPGLFMGAVLAVFLVWFNDQILPKANFRAASLREDISRKRPAVLLQPKTMIQDFDGFRIWIGRSDEKTDSLFDLSIVQLDRMVGNPPTLIQADQGTVRMDSALDAWVFSLRNGQTHTPDRDKPQNYLAIRFLELEVVVPNIDSRLHRTEKSYRGDREMAIVEMLESRWEARQREMSLITDHSNRIFSDVQWVQGLLELDSTTAAGGAIAKPDSVKQGSDTGKTPAKAGKGWLKKPANQITDSAVRANDPNAQRAYRRRRDTAHRSVEAVMSSAGPGRFLGPDTAHPQAAAHTVKSLASARKAETQSAQEQIRWERNEQNRYKVEIHKKFSIPVACILFVLIGAPLGILARSGGVGTGAAYSITFFVLYWAGLIGGEALADRGKVDGGVAMWAPDAFLLIVGSILVSRMGRQSDFFARIQRLFQKGGRA
ncbi:MAG: LptF/LptG family permease [Fibrobacterota bacterium]|nr:MAG: LptF/LptG family permease [Fibrobacterota bacterium]